MFALPSLLKSESSDEPAFMVGFAIGLVLGSLIGAVMWFLIARGIMSGNIAAYLFVALGFAFGAIATVVTGFMAAKSSDVPATVLRLSYSLVLFVSAVIVFLMCLRRSTDG